MKFNRFFSFSFISLVCSFGFLVLSVGAVIAAYGGSTTGVPVCNNSAPKMPWPFWAKASGNNTVDLTWDKVDGASSWTVAYGIKSRTYIYGIYNFGNSESRSVRVNSLPAGRYYFALRANNGCMPGPFSNEWVVIVGGSGIVQTAVQPQVVAQKVTPPVVTPTPKPQTIEPQVTQKVTPPTQKVTPPVVTPTPKPQNVGLWQLIGNFFKSLLGK